MTTHAYGTTHADGDVATGKSMLLVAYELPVLNSIFQLKMAFSVQNNPVTLDDQQKINRFAGISAQLMELKEELTAKQAELESLVCAEDETAMCNDDTSTIPYLIGDALVDMDSQEVKAELERTRTICHAEIADLMLKLGDCKQTFMELRAVLYARFGSTVNLDIDNGI